MKFLTWQNPEQLFVAQELINKVKSKCCGIKEYNFLVGLSKLTPQKGKGGVFTLTKEEVFEHLNTNFKDFLSSRHSIRFYKNCVPDRKKIDEALSIAQKTPSACNRQGWKTHVFLGEKSVDLIRSILR